MPDPFSLIYADNDVDGQPLKPHKAKLRAWGAWVESLPIYLAPKDSPNFTGLPNAPTAANGTNTTQIATTAFVQAAIALLINAAPGALDTLDELAAALGDDANFATTITNALALKAPLASPALTGAPTAPTVAGTADNTTKIATTAFVQAVAALLAPKASPGLTGTPTAPTAANGTNTTQLATTAFVQAAIAALVNAAPGALDTLDELAAALGDDANFATTITNALALKAPLASPALTGAPTAPTQTAGDNTTKLATTAFVTAAVAAVGGLLAATQAQMEAASSTTVAVTPGRQHFHPSAAKAWVNFNGTGTVSIRASFNVSSITDNGTGDYTINFAAALANANYAITTASTQSSGNAPVNVSFNNAFAFTSSSCRIMVAQGTAVLDTAIVTVSFFGET